MTRIKVPSSYNTVFLCFSLAIASISVKRTGWLDRVVEYHKKLFLKDVQMLSPVQINASIERIPPGYVDSPNWDYDSVIHLLILIKESKTAKPVRKALRRMLKPSRRLMSISKKESYKLFPSLKKTVPNEFYYDDTDESTEKSEEIDKSDKTDSEEKEDLGEKALIMVTNPVEARLPSGQISIKLLKEIMEARAEAAREMPPTSKSTILWKPMNKTSPPPTEANTEGAGDEATTAGAAGGDEAGDATAADGGGGGDAPTDGDTGDPTDAPVAD